MVCSSATMFAGCIIVSVFIRLNMVVADLMVEQMPKYCAFSNVSYRSTTYVTK